MEVWKTLLGPVLQFSMAGSEFVQILHDGQLHWLAASNIGCQKYHGNVYNNLNRRSINMVEKKQIASTIKEESQNITIHIQPVRHQSNVLDCAVLVIAFITSLLQGQHPAGATYNNQPLRPYLLECLTEGKMSVFPASNKDFQKKMPSKRDYA